MYIDFHKFNYDLISEDKRELYIERDKYAYKRIIIKWLKANLPNIIERNFEVDEIRYLPETSEFVKLLKEAETLYELGFFTSCLALVCISAEDFTKIWAERNQKQELLEMSQARRIAIMKGTSILKEQVCDSLDRLRILRNNCMHYDKSFKMKNEQELKEDALKAINLFKEIIEETLGSELKKATLEELDKITKEITLEMQRSIGFIKGNDDRIYKLRNALSHLFNIDMTIIPGTKELIFKGIFKVEAIDLTGGQHGEITLTDMTRAELPVFIDLRREDREKFIRLKIKPNDIIKTAIITKISRLGLSGAWNICSEISIDRIS